jgi:excisionase family DNA binding protein
MAQQSPITVSVAEAKRLSGLGHTTVYKLLSEGTLKSTTVGKRRLVRYDSLQELLNPDHREAA